MNKSIFLRHEPIVYTTLMVGAGESTTQTDDTITLRLIGGPTTHTDDSVALRLTVGGGGGSIFSGR